LKRNSIIDPLEGPLTGFLQGINEIREIDSESASKLGENSKSSIISFCTVENCDTVRDSSLPKLGMFNTE